MLYFCRLEFPFFVFFFSPFVITVSTVVVSFVRAAISDGAVTPVVRRSTDNAADSAVKARVPATVRCNRIENRICERLVKNY